MTLQTKYRFEICSLSPGQCLSLLARDFKATLGGELGSVLAHSLV